MTDFGYGSPPGRWDRQSLSLTLGWLCGIRVRLHLFFIVFFVFELLRWYSLGGFDSVLRYGLPLLASIWGLVLLHEFGHCFGCRAVGGRAEDILLWPLGGLAFCEPPHRPAEDLVTTLAGPAVNVAIFVLLIPPLFFADAMSWPLWDPFVFGLPSPETGGLALYLALFWKVNYWLLLFNLALPIFPFDGGRVLQDLLWFKIGHHHAITIATTVGLVGAVLLAAVGLYIHVLLLTAVGIFSFIVCLQTRRELELMGELPENEFGYDFSQGYTSLDRSMSTRKKGQSPSLRTRLRQWLGRRRQREEERLEAELDRILIKIHREGMHRLSRQERKILLQASKRRQP